jgi:hypothetical protein
VFSAIDEQFGRMTSSSAITASWNRFRSTRSTKSA